MDSGDDIARHRGAKTSRKGKRNKKKPAVPAGDDGTMIDVDLDGGDLQEEPFDREALLNQPVSEKQAGKILAFTADIDTTMRAYKQDVMEMAKRLAGNVAEFMRNNQDEVCADNLTVLWN